VEKDMISRFVKKHNWQVLKNPCPFAGETKRKFVENFLIPKKIIQYEKSSLFTFTLKLLEHKIIQMHLPKLNLKSTKPYHN
jgi:hypothetical protein